MATIKIASLPSATAVEDTDYFIIDQSDATRKTPLSQVLDKSNTAMLKNLQENGSQKITHEPTSTRDILLETYLAKAPDIREWDSDSASDDTGRFSKAIAEGVQAVYLPNEDLRVGELNIPTSFKIVGTGSQSINKNGSRLIKPADAAYGLHFNGQGMSTRPMGGGVYNTHLVGENSSNTGPLLKVTSWSYFKFINSSVQNISDWGIVLKDTMESTISEFLFRRIGSDITGAILLDDYLGVANSNVNNLHIFGGTWAGISGAWIKSTSNSNVDVLWINDNKFEWDLIPVSANISEKYVIDLGQISRVYLDRNTFTHFRKDSAHNMYAGILHLGVDCRGIVDFTNNKAYGCDGYFWNIEGGTLCARNNQSNRADASNDISVACTSNKHQDIEQPIIFTNNMNITAKGSDIFDTFISSHKMAGTVNNVFQADSSSIKGTTMVVPAGTEARRFTLSKDYLDGNRGIKVLARVKSQDSVAGAKLKLNIDGTTDIGSIDLPTSGWSLISFIIQPSSIGSGSLRFSNDGTVNLLFDGIKIEEIDYIDVSFAWTPGTIAANSIVTSPAQSGISGFSNAGTILSGFSAPAFDGSSSGLIASVNSRNANAGWEVSLYNPTAAPITPTFTRCKVRIFIK